MTKRHWINMALSGILFAPGLAFAMDSAVDPSTATSAKPVVIPALSVDPVSEPDKPAVLPDSSTPGKQNYIEPSLTLDAGAAAPSRIHGFGDLKIAEWYMTPRGLVVVNEGVNVQPLFGLVFDLYHGDGFIDSVSWNAGIWSNIQSSHPDGDMWTECDLFTGFNIGFLKKFTFSISTEIWMFPDISTKDESNPDTSYNVQFKFTYDDTDLLHAFAIHPYVNVFWNYEGGSPVVLGNNTFYVEMGGAPSYTWKGISNLPITFSFPTYFSVGDSSFWGENANGERSNLGVFSTGMKVSVPLNFVPEGFGSWNAYAGVTYDYMMNPALTEASADIGSGYTHNRVMGYCGVGFGFSRLLDALIASKPGDCNP